MVLVLADAVFWLINAREDHCRGISSQQLLRNLTEGVPDRTGSRYKGDRVLAQVLDGLRHQRNEILADLDRSVRVPFVRRQQRPWAAKVEGRSWCGGGRTTVRSE